MTTRKQSQAPVGTGAPAQPKSSRSSQLSWIALAVAGLLTVWHVVFAITVQGMAGSDQEVFVSIWLVVSLVLAVGCGVLGIVAAAQKARPQWPATASMAIGTVVFIAAIAAWLGGLLAGS